MRMLWKSQGSARGSKFMEEGMTSCVVRCIEPGFIGPKTSFRLVWALETALGGFGLLPRTSLLEMPCTQHSRSTFSLAHMALKPSPSRKVHLPHGDAEVAAQIATQRYAHIPSAMKCMGLWTQCEVHLICLNIMVYCGLKGCSCECLCITGNLRANGTPRQGRPCTGTTISAPAKQGLNENRCRMGLSILIDASGNLPQGGCSNESSVNLCHTACTDTVVALAPLMCAWQCGAGLRAISLLYHLSGLQAVL